MNRSYLDRCNQRASFLLQWTPVDARILKREFVERKQRGEFFTERELMDQHAYLKEEAAW